MRISLLIIAITLTLPVLGQDSTPVTISIKGWHGDSRRLPTKFDTVYLVTKPKQTVKVFTNVSTSDSVFLLPDIPVGKYWLRFSADKYCVMPFPIVACSKCDNHFEFFAAPKNSGDNCDIFSMVEISPNYLGGNKALSKDFQRLLSKKERKQLKSLADFKVHFYLTKQKAISDVSLLPDDLPQEVKSVLIKGLAGLSNWNPAIQNGRVVDAEITLDKQALLIN
jgi:hypothetical protein